MGVKKIFGKSHSKEPTSLLKLDTLTEYFWKFIKPFSSVVLWKH